MTKQSKDRCFTEEDFYTYVTKPGLVSADLEGSRMSLPGVAGLTVVPAFPRKCRCNPQLRLPIICPQPGKAHEGGLPDGTTSGSNRRCLPA